jgi:site-specific DNA-methyltransferase (adenine-specific)/modification methylase
MTTNGSLNKIYKKDCISFMNDKLSLYSIDMIFADPPYNLSGKKLKLTGSATGGDWEKVNEDWDTFSGDDYQSFTDEWILASKKCLKPNGSLYVCASQHNLGNVLNSLDKSGFKVNNIIVWQKSNPMPNMTRRVFTHSIEFIVWAVAGKGWVFNSSDLKKINPDLQKDGNQRAMRDVWNFPVVQGLERIKSADKKALHPTQKPLELVKRTIIASTNVGDIIYDPFMGSGTTAVAAKMLERDFIGTELNEKYITAARARIIKIKK